MKIVLVDDLVDIGFKLFRTLSPSPRDSSRRGVLGASASQAVFL